MSKTRCLRLSLLGLATVLVATTAHAADGLDKRLRLMADGKVIAVGPKPTPAKTAAATFELAEPGRFKTLETGIGTWTPTAGTTIVDNKHARTGKHCLQLTGGKKTRVTLKIAQPLKAKSELTFWAERWTRRKPFSFRIEQNTRTGWKEIFNGDREIRVGRPFLSFVRVPLDDLGTRQLRFSVTSPPNTGILIDDLRIDVARPQKILSVQADPLSIPALVGNLASPLVRLRVETSGRLDPISLTDLSASLRGTTDRSDLASIAIYDGGTTSRFPSGKPVATLDAATTALRRFVVSFGTSSIRLVEGTNHIWIACRIAQDANIDHRVGATCDSVTFSNGTTFKLQSIPSIQRMGIALRTAGDERVHTYRIPGLTTTNTGTLIAVYDVRRRSGGDLPGDIDVGMSRSTDGGRSWKPMQVIMDMGSDPRWRYDGIGDPAVLVDRQTGAIWVAATWSHGNRSWRGSGPGLKPIETGQLMLVRSDDDGRTWSQPINITSQVKRPEWCFLLQGPGKGITMRNGTLVFAAQYQDPPSNNRLPHATIIYSQDHGSTWQIGTGAFDDTTESQVVEISPGVLMLNCRYNRQSHRVVMTTRDMGKTWQTHPTSLGSLIEPRACMASLISVDRELGNRAGGRLLFSNPHSTSGRDHITIKASHDNGMTWPTQLQLLLDEGRGGGYSCMTMIDAETIGILYEGSRAQMTFQRIRLGDLESSQKRPAP
jgi:sialidase-1